MGGVKLGVETDDKSKRIQRSYKKLGRTLRKTGYSSWSDKGRAWGTDPCEGIWNMGKWDGRSHARDVCLCPVGWSGRETVLLKRSVWNKTVLLLRNGGRKTALRNNDPKDYGTAGICKRIKRRDASALFKPYLCGGRKYIFPRSEKAASGPVSCMAERKAYDRALLDASVSSGQ